MVSIEDLITNLHVVELPLRVRFRNVDSREIALWEGPSGWGEFPPFLEYSPEQCVPWLESALEASFGEVPKAERRETPVNGTIPAVAPSEVDALVGRFVGVQAFKIKVAQKGENLAHDIKRIEAVLRAAPDAKIRLDANGGWSFDEARRAVDALEIYDLEYIEQPVRSLSDLKKIKDSTDIPIAADESIRLSHDATEVIKQDAADVLILKVAPLGGVKKVQELATLTDKKIVISSALESSVGMHRGVLAADSVCPEVPCGLGTVSLFAHDICDTPLIPENGYISTQMRTPSQELLQKYAVSRARKSWWEEKIRATFALR